MKKDFDPCEFCFKSSYQDPVREFPFFNVVGRFWFPFSGFLLPEWYFLPFYAILRAVPDKLGGVLAMFGAIAVLFILPWLDRSPIRSGNFRPIFKIFFWVFFADCIALGYLGGMPAEGIYVVLSRVATAWYFLHFLVILPLLSVIETPKPLPQSLSKSVLGGSAMVGAASAVKEKV